MKNEEHNFKIAKLYGYTFAVATLLFFAVYFLVDYLNVYNVITISFLAVSTILFITLALACIKFDYELGCYKCSNCHKNFKPSYGEMLRSIHKGRKLRLRCPHCDTKMWAEKCYEDLNEKEKRN